MSLICIYANPRSGSSLVAKIFRAHGVWTETPRPNFRGYPDFEWHQLKDVVRPPTLAKWDDCSFHDIHPLAYKKIDEIVSQRKEDFFLFKGAPDYHQFLAMYNPTVITVRRKAESVARSQQADEQWRGVIEKRIQMMEAMDAPVVDADELIAGDFTSIQHALEHCGIAFDLDISKAQIDRSLWHHG